MPNTLNHPSFIGSQKYFFLKTGLLFLTIIFFIFPQNRVQAQVENQFKDEFLETLLKQNKIKESKIYLNEKKDSIPIFHSEKQGYYFNKLSQVNMMDGDFNASLSDAKKASNALEKTPKSQLWGETYRALCFAYIRTGKLDSALIFAEKLYYLTKTNGDQTMKRAALLALGNISLQNKSYEKSLEFYTEALQTTLTIKDSASLKVDYYNIGLALARLKDHEKSNSYLLKAVELAEKEKVWDLVARSYGSIADNFSDKKDFDSQEIYIKKANEIAEKIGNKQLLAMGYASLTESALRKQNFNEAVLFANKSLKSMGSRPIIQLQAKLDSMLYVAHKNLGEYKASLSKLEEYEEKRLSIRNEAQKERLNELTVKFEVEKKDLLIANQESSIREEKAKNQAFLIGIALFATFSFSLVYNNIKNSKTRNLLFRKEKELDQVVSIKSVERKPILGLEETIKEIYPENDKDYRKLFNEILDYIQVNKLYLDPKFNQQTLLNEFGSNRKYLYQAISKNGDDNFRGLINRFRINETKSQLELLLQNGELVDFSILAEKVGFNSYATFYRSFKNITGLTPNEYLKELQKEKEG